MTDNDQRLPGPRQLRSNTRLPVRTRDGPRIDRETLHDVLSNDRRRRILYTMTKVSTPLGIDELAALMTGGPANDPDEYHETLIRLSHCDVPKLADVGLLEYDTESTVVSPTAVTDRIAKSIDLTRS